MSNAGWLTHVCLLFACSLCYSKALPAKLNPEAVNDRPVIGILTQIVSDEEMKPFGRTYIPSSYVKFIESGGSRVMSIRLTLKTTEYEKIFSNINGLLLIGGAADLETSDFARVAKIFYRLALMANDDGDYFPIWGTCMGMQLLTVLVAGENLLESTTADNVALPLDLTPEASSSRMFQGFPNNLMKALTSEPLTGNFHHYGVAVKTFQGNEKLQSFFSLLSTNVAENGVRFVSTIEGKTYPFYGVQWHPEVNRFQWNIRLNFPHSAHAVLLSSLVAEFFVNEGIDFVIMGDGLDNVKDSVRNMQHADRADNAHLKAASGCFHWLSNKLLGRRSLHHFDNPEEEASSLIYTNTPVYAGNFTAYEQLYFF